MSLNKSKLVEAQDKRDLIEISTLIDLTDKPIGLTRDEIGWSKVRSTASNCICCCSNNSITLVTTNDSYILDHIPLDNIQFAQANSTLQYLALSNHNKIAIIDLADNDSKCGCQNKSKQLASETKVINLASVGLTMNDIIFWRWLDESLLAILSYEALYTCCLNQQHINHPAYTAFSNRSRYLNVQKVFDTHQYLSALCQVTDIHRDLTGNLFAISSLYSTGSLIKLNNETNQHPTTTTTNTQASAYSNNPTNTPTNPRLKSSFGSMPCRLSQLAGNDQSFESLKSEHLFDSRRSLVTRNQIYEDEICGLIQVHCRIRNRSQLIQAHAITFTNPLPPKDSSFEEASCSNQRNPTILIAANKIGNQMRVHFIEMATSENYPTFGVQNASPMLKFNRLSGIDFPTSIVCSHVSNPENGGYLHVALITTKHGQLFVCSVAHSTLLFSTTITADIISSAILEVNTQGLMIICRNGRVLLVKLKLAKLLKLLEESKTLRHISSSHNMLNSVDLANNNRIINDNNSQSSSKLIKSNNQLSTSLDIGLEVMISTKL